MESFESDAESLVELDEDRALIRTGLLQSLLGITCILYFFDCGMLLWLYPVFWCAVFDGMYKSTWTSDFDLNLELLDMYQNAGRTFVEVRNYEFVLADIEEFLTVSSVSVDPPAKATVEIQNSLYKFGKVSLDLSFNLYEPNNYGAYNIDQCIKNQVSNSPKELELLQKLLIPERSSQQIEDLDHLLWDERYVFDVKFESKEAFKNHVFATAKAGDGLRLAHHHKEQLKKRKIFRNEEMKIGMFSTSLTAYKDVKKLYFK